jgi:hypothetical protein
LPLARILILLKLLAGKIIDRVYVMVLLKENVAMLNLPHLQQWADQLKLAEALRDTGTEAPPDVPFPQQK